jgi:hypothetical protein
MPPDDHREAKELFGRVVVDLERDRRASHASLVGKACAERPHLGREVESPQLAYEKAGAFRSPDLIASRVRRRANQPHCRRQNRPNCCSFKLALTLIF